MAVFRLASCTNNSKHGPLLQACVCTRRARWRNCWALILCVFNNNNNDRHLVFMEQDSRQTAKWEGVCKFEFLVAPKLNHCNSYFCLPFHSPKARWSAPTRAPVKKRVCVCLRRAKSSINLERHQTIVVVVVLECQTARLPDYQTTRARPQLAGPSVELWQRSLESGESTSYPLVSVAKLACSGGLGAVANDLVVVAHKAPLAQGSNNNNRSREREKAQEARNISHEKRSTG